MSTTNYFKVSGEPFFFDDAHPNSVAEAWVDANMRVARLREEIVAGSFLSEDGAAAKRRAVHVCVWAKPRLSGPWEHARLLGDSGTPHSNGSVVPGDDDWLSSCNRALGPATRTAG